MTVRGRRKTVGPVSEVTDDFVRELNTMLTTLVARAPLFADLRSRGHADDLVQDTLMTITRRIDNGHTIEEPFTYARRCVENLAKRTYLRGSKETAVGDDALELMAPAMQDVAEHVEQRMLMGEVLEMVRAVNGIIADLEPLELELVRAELARTDQKKLAARLGISRPTLYRRKGPAIAAFVAAVATRAGTTPCPDHAGALLAAAGASGFDGARAATEHAATCEQCSETIRHLAVARHGLAIISPIPLVSTGGDPVRAVERGTAWLDAVTDWLRAVVTRVGDPTPLGGSATKTVAIVAAACTGGGGVYCAIDGVPSQLTAPFVQREAPKSTAARPAPARKAATAQNFLPTSAALRQVSTVVTAVNTQETARLARVTRVNAARAAAAQRRRRQAAAAAAAKRRREQAAREFAARQTATTTPAAGPSEFAAPAPSPAATVTKREFTKPSSGGSTAASQTQQEFGTP